MQQLNSSTAQQRVELSLWQRISELILAIILAAAGAVKVIPSIFGINWASDKLYPAWVLVLVAMFEILFAVLLISRQHRQVTYLAVPLIAIGSCISFIASYYLRKDCGCTGPVDVANWVKPTVVFAIFLLWLKLPILQYVSLSAVASLLTSSSQRQSLVTICSIVALFTVSLGTYTGRRFVGMDGDLVYLVSGSELDVGAGLSDEVLTRALVVRNESGRDINIIGQNASCGCVSTGPFPILIPANSNREVLVSVDLTQKEEGRFRYHVNLFLDSKAQPDLDFLVKGNVAIQFGMAD